MKTSTTILLICILFSNFQAQSTWEITTNNIDPNNYYGVTVANGMIGIVSSPNPLKVKDVVLNGVYDYYQRGRVSNILKAFNHVNMELEVDRERINAGNITGLKQSLDMKRAVFNTSFSFKNKVEVKHSMMALRHLPYTAMIIVEITAKQNVTITPYSVLEAPNHLSDVRNYYAEIDRPHVKIPLMTSVALSPSGKHKVAASNSFIFPEDHGSEPDIIHEDWDYNMHLAKFNKELRAGQTYRFAIVASACTTEHYEDPHNEAERLTIYAMLEGIDRLLKRHLDAWEELWKSDIIIEGDESVQRDVRSAIYHLYSFAREGTAYSLSPMGLSGLGYNGHVFWDTELWMYRPLLVLQPGVARSLLEYRFERLQAAKQNAFAHGFDGAMYPWESAGDGSEDTPVWALTGPFQHHISGDIAWAAWEYYLVTKDKDWLSEKGWPMIKEVADFWTSRVERNGPNKYDINNVIGANEWEENIDNNAFTNGMAITALRVATKAAMALGKTPDPDWEHVAKNIPILKFPDGTTKENATYNGVEIKQADVNLLSYPLKIVTEEKDIKRDLAYYEPRMSPTGPAMAHSVLSTLYARLGDYEKAYMLFKRGFEPNKVPPFGVISETAGGTNPYFATGAGGMLQAVLFGIGGLDINENGVEKIGGGLPKSWKKLQLMGVGINEEVFNIR